MYTEIKNLKKKQKPINFFQKT